MGVGWRRFTERLHQGGPLRGGGLQPTDNTRCSSMLTAAKAFVQQLRKCERAVRTMAAANSESATAISEAMAAALPLRFEEAAGGSRGGGAIGGDGFRPQAMVSAVQEAGRKVDAEVLAPLQRWHDVYTQLGVRYADLENLRLEVDSRRRTVAELSNKVDAVRAQLGSRGSDAKLEATLEQSMKRLGHKEGKLQAAAQSFADHEQLLHRDLSTLVTDARWLKHYAAAALRLEGNALLAAAKAFGPLEAGPSPPASKVAAPPGTPVPAPGQPRVPAGGAAQGSPRTPVLGLEPPVARFPVAAAPVV